MTRLRSFLPEILITLALVAAVGYFGYLAWGLMEPAEEPFVDTDFVGTTALAHVETQLAFGPRITGTEPSVQMGDWLIQALQALGWTVAEQPYTVADGVAARNIIAYKANETEDAPIAILGAHYDTRMIADEDPNPDLRFQPVPGANDGASGVAVLLELARSLDVAETGHTVCLAFFDAEDNGRIPEWDWILGSSYFVANRSDVPACADPRFALIVDMIGDADQQVYVERNGTPGLSAALWQQAADLGYGDTIINQPGYAMLDDHTPFLRAGIPAADMIDFDYPHWHTTDDTLDKVSAESLERIGRTVESWMEAGAVFDLP